MLITPRLTSKPAPYILYPLVFILSLFLSLSWVSAKEKPKPNPQAWQINGIVAALSDGHDQVKGYAFDKLTEYDLNNLKTVIEKPEDIAKKAVDILKNKTVDAWVRSSAASALGNLGEAAKPYVKDIADILKDKTV
ncbi:MAG: PBS lyase, partial [Gloeotrichia echinulata HAB0833]